jgi:hypothetical protein
MPGQPQGPVATWTYMAGAAMDPLQLQDIWTPVVGEGWRQRGGARRSAQSLASIAKKDDGVLRQPAIRTNRRDN